MPSTKYTISYDKQIQMLAFRYEVLPNNGDSLPLAKLFNDFGYNLAQTKKIDELPLPRLIREDIKLSFSRS